MSLLVGVVLLSGVARCAGRHAASTVDSAGSVSTRGGRQATRHLRGRSLGIVVARCGADRCRAGGAPASHPCRRSTRCPIRSSSSSGAGSSSNWPSTEALGQGVADVVGSRLSRSRAAARSSGATPNTSTSPSKRTGCASCTALRVAGASSGTIAAPGDDHVVEIGAAVTASARCAGRRRGLVPQIVGGIRRRRGSRLAAERADGGSRAAGSARRVSARGGGAAAGSPAWAPLQTLDALDHRLDRRACLAAGQAHERDLEHEPRIGGLGAAHVGDRLTERLDRADQGRVAERVTDLAQAVLFVRRGVDACTRPRAAVRTKASRAAASRSSATRRGS